MERSGFATCAKLPGFDSLQSALHDDSDAPLNEVALMPFVEDSFHRKYLENIAFHRYLKMHKVTTGISGARELQVLAHELEDEYMPTYKDAAAWAYAEAGLIDTSLSTLERVQLVAKAESLWQEALQTQTQLETSEYGACFNQPSDAYRYALPLVFSPLMKSVIVGNVTPTIRKQALVDTVSFSDEVAKEIHRYNAEGNKACRNLFIGLAHELNALSTLLYLDDPRYIPMPSTARADTGYYHPDQTHDIMVINQHWGTIRKVIPIEIKAKASLRDRRRYKSLIIRGKMHLATAGTDPTETSASFSRFVHGTSTLDDLVALERMSTDIREMLRLYQQGVIPESLAVHSLTKFQRSRSLEKAHPEIAP